MQQWENYIKLLTNHCPKCGLKIFAYWKTPLPDFPETGAWYIECDSITCDYIYPGYFTNIEDLSKRFQFGV